MKKQRARSDSSSLDLFLDTISNTFGSIVFITILVSVLVQMRTRVPASTSEVNPLSPQEIREMVLRMEQLQMERQELIQLESQLSIMSPDSDDLQVSEKQAKVDDLEKDLQRQLDAQNKASQDLAKQLEENAEIQQDLETLQKQLSEAQAALEQERDALDETMDEKLQVFTPPKLKATFKQGLPIFVRYGRVYPLYLPNSQKPDSNHVRTVERGSDLAVYPITGKGWDISTDAGRANLRRYLSYYSSGTTFVNLVVWADSFDVFLGMKTVLVDADFEYQLKPFPNDAEVILTQASERPQVQ